VLLDNIRTACRELPPSAFEPRSRTRDIILSSTRWLLRDRPLDAVCMEDVAQAAGLSRRTIYNQFDDLETLFRACYEQLINELSRALRAEIPQAGDPQTALSLFGGAVARLFSDGRYADLVRQIVRVGDAHTWLDEACRRQIKAPLVIAVENHLLHHRRSFGGLDARLTAARFVTAIESLSVWPTLLRPWQPDTSHVVDVQIAHLTRALLARRREPRTSATS
jgi:AcrR family transcriptional regulator